MNNNDTEEKRKINWSSWVILAVITAPMLMAYFVYSTGFGLPQGTLNKGDLLLPATDINPLIITLPGSKEKVHLADKKIWRMVIVGNNDCDSACQKMLYLSRQVHIRLGEKANRVERLYLNTADTWSAPFAAELKKEHPKLVQAQIDPVAWRNLFSQTSISGHTLSAENIYLIDQQGFAMMSYDITHSGADLLDDTKRLLKYSYED